MKMMKILKEREVRKFQQRKVERGEKTVKMKMKWLRKEIKMMRRKISR